MGVPPFRRADNSSIQLFHVARLTLDATLRLSRIEIKRGGSFNLENAIPNNHV